MAQLLEAQGFDVSKLSLDRTPDGYMALRSILLEERIDMLDVKLLQDELVHLQRDGVTGKIDHPLGGSKDTSDSFAGAIWNAVLTNPGVPVATKSVTSLIRSVNTRSPSLNDKSQQLPSMFPSLYNNTRRR